ncbi:ectoderm-neural cortex protein 1-like [Mercenaria mercenaria]|uniref:ectoderm-neural cortex protein 1-like n=1 Tax=Mercenaria mercenaria TaxID=6596 RepID=UPI00234F2DDA|nr:ectoderm-neural cortex protein 1-like [Mercenaria mercenaria]
MASKKRSDPVIDWQSLARTIHKGIVQLKQEDSFTDFIVEVGNKSFRCHKVVLASVSDYFKAMFSSGMKETELSKAVLDDVSPESFDTIIKILYPEGNINPLENPSETDISDLLKLAGRFQMPFLHDICLKYYGRTMAVGNCIMRWKLGEAINCDELSDLGFGFIKENFEEMATDDIHVSMEFDDFLTIIKDESMHVKREDIVWSAIRNWIKFDLEKRQTYIAELLRECCLTEIDPDLFMEEIVFDPIVRQSDKASRLLQDSLKYKRHPGIHGDIELKFRECHEKRQVTLFLVREDERADNIDAARKDLKGFVICSDNARRITIDRFMDIQSRSLGGLSYCVHGQSVFVLTGNKIRGSQLWEYVGADNAWERKREMELELVGNTMCAADGCLYVIGGKSGRHLNAQVWQYSIDSNSWTIDGEIMASVVFASSVCVNNKIYIFGGKLEDNAPADCIQVYDTETKTGTIFGTLPKPCSWSRALVRGITAYVVTSDGNVVNVSLETGESAVIATIPNFRRVNFGISLQRNELYVFGGKENDDDDDDTDEELEATVKTNASIKGDFVVNTETGDIKASKWLQKSGYTANCEVLASVSVVLDPTKLQQLTKKTLK